MDKQRWILYIQRLKTPVSILILTVAAGLGIILMLFLFVITPHLKERHDIRDQYNRLAEQKRSLLLRSSPAPVTSEQIEHLVKKVPTRDELAQLLVELRELEQKSGVSIENIGVFKDKASNDDLSSLLSGANTGSNSGAGGTPTSGNGSQLNGSSPPTGGNDAQANGSGQQVNGTETQNGSTSASKLEEQMFTLHIMGTYPQIIRYIDLLHHSERLIGLKKWELQMGENTDRDTAEAATARSGPSPETPAVQQNIHCTIQIAVYTAKSYAGLSPTTPEDMDTNSQRKDPTWSDSAFYDLLKKQLSESVTIQP